MPNKASRFSRARLAGWVALAVLVSVVLVLGAMVLGTTRSAPGDPGPARPTAGPRVIRFAAVGDSITQGNSPDFSVGLTGTLSWVTYARSSLDLFVGGWAAGGATTARMAENVEPVKADVLVIIAGTNDLAEGVPFDVTASNLERIVATVGAPRVVVSAIPPRNSVQAATVVFNASLKVFVLAHQWEWADAPAGVRDGDQYAPGMSLDGVHPSEAAAEALGRALAAAMSR